MCTGRRPNRHLYMEAEPRRNTFQRVSGWKGWLKGWEGEGRGGWRGWEGGAGGEGVEGNGRGRVVPWSDGGRGTLGDSQLESACGENEKRHSHCSVRCSLLTLDPPLLCPRLPTQPSTCCQAGCRPTSGSCWCPRCTQTTTPGARQNGQRTWSGILAQAVSGGGVGVGGGGGASFVSSWLSHVPAFSKPSFVE